MPYRDEFFVRLIFARFVILFREDKTPAENTVLLLTFQDDLFYYQDKTDITKKTWYDNKNEDIKQLHFGDHTNSTNSVRNRSYFAIMWT